MAKRISAARRKATYRLKPGDSDLIANLVQLLKLARPTPFALEGMLVAIVRSDRCAVGVKFPLADLAARELVRRALNQVGARRPSVDEGQRWYVSQGADCQTCGGPLEGETSRRYFCSDECAIIATARKNAKEERWRHGWEHSIRYSLMKGSLPERQCAQCGTTYQGKLDSAYCSRRCAHIARRTIPDKECEACGETFTPQRNEIRFCSRKCAGVEKKTREDVKCQAPGCGNHFKPRNVGRGRAETANRYCSQKCYWAAKGKAKLREAA